MCTRCQGPVYVNRINETGNKESLCYPCIYAIWKKTVYGK